MMDANTQATIKQNARVIYEALVSQIQENLAKPSFSFPTVDEQEQSALAVYNAMPVPRGLKGIRFEAGYQRPYSSTLTWVKRPKPGWRARIVSADGRTVEECLFRGLRKVNSWFKDELNQARISCYVQPVKAARFIKLSCVVAAPGDLFEETQ